MKQNEIHRNDLLFRCDDIKMRPFTVVGVTRVEDQRLDIKPTIWLRPIGGRTFKLDLRTACEEYSIIKGVGKVNSDEIRKEIRKRKKKIDKNKAEIKSLETKLEKQLLLENGQIAMTFDDPQ